MTAPPPSRMRILLVIDAGLEIGRGPLFRIMGMLPHLVEQADVCVVTLGEPAPDVVAQLQACKVPSTAAPCELDGWSMTTADAAASCVDAQVVAWSPDLLVLSWEIWDLVERLAMIGHARNTPFAVALHAIPLLNAPAAPSDDYQADLDARLPQIRDPRMRDYICAHRAAVPQVLHRVGVLAVNRTVEWMLRRYFPDLETAVVDPSYALDADLLPTAEADSGFDAAFMAKLIADKGIFDLLDAVACIRARRPSFRCLVIGSFDDDETRDRFMQRRRALDLEDAVVCTGWLEGRPKYEALATARVFLYPSTGTDTFSICLLEALAVGLPVVCYDAPYVRQTYASCPVTAVRAGDSAALAEAVVALLDQPDQLAARSRDAKAFATEHLDWAAVAGAELAAYSDLLQRVRGAA